MAASSALAIRSLDFRDFTETPECSTERLRRRRARTAERFQREWQHDTMISGWVGPVGWLTGVATGRGRSRRSYRVCVCVCSHSLTVRNT